MKATEIFAEQLLIGLMVLIIGVLLGFGAIPGLPYGTDNLFGDFFFGFLVLGGAYIVGMVYDRIADTILQDLERHNQLQFALKKYVKKGQDLVFDTDPLPIGRMRIRLLAKGKELASHAGYLRSRMRLTRATATLMPALSLALLMLQINSGQQMRLIISAIIIVAYGIVLVLKLTHFPESPPSTKDLGKLGKYIERHKKTGKKEDSTKLRLLYRDLFGDTALLGLVLLTIAGIVVAFLNGGYDLLSLLFRLAYPIAGFLMALLVGWVWWRISKTYLKFHLGFDKYIDRHEEEKGS